MEPRRIGALAEGGRVARAIGREEQDRRCVPATGPNGSKRLTLTFPALNAARHVFFLVLGADKRDALRRIRSGEQLPAARVSPVHGDVTWIVDAAAYGE